MPALAFQYREGGIYFPRLHLWLDPHWPKQELVFVSHAHSDHVADHREVILSEPTARLMQARMGGKRIEHALHFGEARTFGGTNGVPEFHLTLLPAGHIFGSAMSLLQCDGESLLYTGDFKLRRGLSAEPCEPRHANVLIMETTYGQPHYRFPPTDEVMRGMIRFCKESLDNDETPVLLGYSLGKSQELLCGFADAGLPIVLHGTVYNLTKVYEQFGHCFPAYEKYQAGNAQGKVVLCPPSVANSAMLRNLGKTRCAVLTGWAVDPGCKYRSQCDAAFPISDHADFPDLIEFVQRVQPKKVYTLHGFAADFAATLRGLGFEAHALSEDEQMRLALEESPRSKVQGPRSGPESWVERRELRNAELTSLCDSRASTSFLRFAETCSAIAGTSSKLEKVRVLAEYLQPLDRECIPVVTVWFTGLPFAASTNKVLQVGWALLRDALCSVAGVDETELHHVYLKHSDLGETAFELFESEQGRARCPQRAESRQNDVAAVAVHARRAEDSTPYFGATGGPSLLEIEALFEALQSARGPSAKLPLLISAFERCSPLEAKFLVKIITSDLRIGLKEGLVEEAIAKAFNVSADEVRAANLLLGNIGETATLAVENRLNSAGVIPFRPVKFMLASPEETAADIWKRLGEAVPPATEMSEQPSASGPVLTLNPTPAPPESAESKSKITSRSKSSAKTVWLEDKYDGIRCQLHKVGSRVALYSRDLKEITTTFHDVADAARALPGDVILDGEILGMRGEEVLPFAELQKRLGRREHDLFLRDEVPIQFIAFDLLWLNDESKLNQPLRERRRLLEQLAPLPTSFRLARITQANSAVDIEATFSAARERNNEGLMAKDPESVYSPGRRGLAWLKLKKALATLDCVVIGAEYGHGKRNKVLSDYTFAVRDERTGELKAIGKAYSGLTDAEIAQLTKHFQSRTIEQHGRYHVVEPDTVLEIAFDKLQPSDRHSSGLAMRFPRIVRIRADKSVAEINTLESARRLVS